MRITEQPKYNANPFKAIDSAYNIFELSKQINIVDYKTHVAEELKNLFNLKKNEHLILTYLLSKYIQGKDFVVVEYKKITTRHELTHPTITTALSKLCSLKIIARSQESNIYFVNKNVFLIKQGIAVVNYSIIDSNKFDVTKEQSIPIDESIENQFDADEVLFPYDPGDWFK